jgi:hypothetical protein
MPAAMEIKKDANIDMYSPPFLAGLGSGNEASISHSSIDEKPRIITKNAAEFPTAFWHKD